MSDVPESLQADVLAAVSPTARDLMEARTAILATLSERTSATADEVEQLVLAGKHVGPTEGQAGGLEVARTPDGVSALNPDEPFLVRLRVRSAVRESMGVLAADGLIMQVAGNYWGEASASVLVTITHGGGSAGTHVQYTDRTPVYGGDMQNARWRLVRPADHPMQLVGAASLGDGLGALLGPRGEQVLAEAVRCFRRGLYMAAVDLLAAASEAAWFTLGAEAQDDERLATAVAAGRDAAEVMNRTANSLERAGVLKTHALRDLRSHAAVFRALRNYGVHPVGATLDEHEEAFTETGAALLFMNAASYFSNLRTALEGLQSKNASAGTGA